MTNSGLPSDWAALSHSARVRKAVEVGRRSRSDAAAARLLREWSAGGFTERLLATFAGHGSRDSAALLAWTADRSRSIARVAMSVLGDVGDDDSLLAALRDLPPRHAARLLFQLRRARPGLVDRFVTERAAEGDVAAWPLGARLLAVRSAVLAAVGADPAVVSLAVPLAAARFAAEPFARWVLNHVGTDRWHAPTQLAVLDALDQVGHSAADLERAEAVWAASPDPAARWLALRVLGRAASAQGWSDSRRERLQRYREDPSPLVADEAALTLPPEPELPALSTSRGGIP